MLSDRLVAELKQEAATTRRVLERVPEEKLGWTPHPKSMSMGQLAMHIAVLPRGIAEIVTSLDNELPTVPRPEATSLEEIVSALESSVEFAAAKLSEWNDADLAAIWTLRQGEKILLELPRGDVIRAVMLNHWYHHRGQLTVYLRLLDVPLPAVYGSSADENLFN